MKPFESTIDQMIQEQGEQWLANDQFKNRSEVHNAVIITDHPEQCWRVRYVDGQWLKEEGRLSASELADFFAAFGSHWTVLLYSHVSSDLVPVRAFIRNGRKRGGFSISIDSSKPAIQKRYYLHCDTCHECEDVTESNSSEMFDAKHFTHSTRVASIP